MLNVHTEFRQVTSTDCLYLDQFSQGSHLQLNFGMCNEFYHRPVLCQMGSSCFWLSPEHIFLLVQWFLRNCSPKSFIFSLFWNSPPKAFICSSGSLWVEVLGTPAYVKLLPDGGLLCARGVFAEILRVVPQGEHNWGSQPHRLRQLSQSGTANKRAREDSNPGSSAHRPAVIFITFYMEGSLSVLIRSGDNNDITKFR